MTPVRLAVLSDRERERETLRRLEQIRRLAWEEGAWGTPGLDRDIAETRSAIATLEHEEPRVVV